MKKVDDSVGIDVSKLTIDVHIYNLKIHSVFANKKSGFIEMEKWIRKQGLSPSKVLYCFENTGWYSMTLSYFFYGLDRYYVCENALEIKRSIGLKREKSDKADSSNIAHYAWLRREELESSVPPTKKLIELQRMISLREQLTKQIVSLKNMRHGMLPVISSPSTDRTMMILEQSLSSLVKQLKKIDKEMEFLICEEVEMKRNYDLVLSVRGIGKVLATQLILHTHNFTCFENARQFSAYCGLAPYPFQSGTSIKGRSRVHSIGDKKMKSLINTCAVSAVQHDKELRAYYQRRIEEGKPKMLVLNIIRNKIITRAFAVIKRGTPFVELNQHAA